jgi:VCBS repeat-containing protein
MSQRSKKDELKSQSFLIALLSAGLAACGGGGGGGGTPVIDPGGGGDGDNVIPAVSGTVFKGPLENASVFIDTDGNGERGSNDSPMVLTDENGAFQAAAGFVGDIIVQVGPNTIDTFAAGTPLDGLVLQAPSGYSVVSPATTLVSVILDSSDGQSVSDVEARIKSALGLGNVELRTFNPFQDTDAEAALIYELKSQQIVSIANSVSQLTLAAGGRNSSALADALGSIAEVINNASLADPSNPVDLASSAVIEGIINEISDPNGLNFNTKFAEKAEELGSEAISSVKDALVLVNTAISNVQDISSSGAQLSKIQNIGAAEISKIASGENGSLGSLSDIDNYVVATGKKNLEFEENANLTAEVQLSIIDPDYSDNVTYKFSSNPIFNSGTLSGGGSIPAQLGNLTVSEAGVVAFSMNASQVDFLAEGETLVQIFTLPILDDNGNEAESEILRVVVSGVNDAPVFTSTGSVSVLESTNPGDSIFQVTADDPEGDSVIFSLTGDDASAFSLGENGVLSFVSAPDFEQKSAYALGVKATDANGLFSESSLVVSVVDSGDFISTDTTNVGQNYSTVVTLNFEDLNDFNSEYDLSSGLTGFVVGLEALQGWDVVTGKNGGSLGSWSPSVTGENIETVTELDVSSETAFRVAVLSTDGANIAGTSNELVLGTLSYSVASSVTDFDLVIKDSYIATSDPINRIDVVDYQIDII